MLEEVVSSTKKIAKGVREVCSYYSRRMIVYALTTSAIIGIGVGSLRSSNEKHDWVPRDFFNFVNCTLEEKLGLAKYYRITAPGELLRNNKRIILCNYDKTTDKYIVVADPEHEILRTIDNAVITSTAFLLLMLLIRRYNRSWMEIPKRDIRKIALESSGIAALSCVLTHFVFGKVYNIIPEAKLLYGYSAVPLFCIAYYFLEKKAFRKAIETKMMEEDISTDTRIGKIANIRKYQEATLKSIANGDMDSTSTRMASLFTIYSTLSFGDMVLANRLYGTKVARRTIANLFRQGVSPSPKRSLEAFLSATMTFDHDVGSYLAKARTTDIRERMRNLVFILSLSNSQHTLMSASAELYRLCQQEGTVAPIAGTNSHLVSTMDVGVFAYNIVQKMLSNDNEIISETDNTRHVCLSLIGRGDVSLPYPLVKYTLEDSRIYGVPAGIWLRQQDGFHLDEMLRRVSPEVRFEKLKQILDICVRIFQIGKTSDSEEPLAKVEADIGGSKASPEQKRRLRNAIGVCFKYINTFPWGYDYDARPANILITRRAIVPLDFPVRQKTTMAYMVSKLIEDVMPFTYEGFMNRNRLSMFAWYRAKFKAGDDEVGPGVCNDRIASVLKAISFSRFTREHGPDQTAEMQKYRSGAFNATMLLEHLGSMYTAEEKTHLRTLAEVMREMYSSPQN